MRFGGHSPPAPNCARLPRIIGALPGAQAGGQRDLAKWWADLSHLDDLGRPEPRTGRGPLGCPRVRRCVPHRPRRTGRALARRSGAGERGCGAVVSARGRLRRRQAAASEQLDLCTSSRAHRGVAWSETPPRPRRGGGCVTPSRSPSAVCSPQRMEVRAGVYLRGGGGRFRAEPGHSADDRLHVSYFELTGGGATGPGGRPPLAIWRCSGGSRPRGRGGAGSAGWRWLCCSPSGCAASRSPRPSPERRWLDRALGVAVGGLALWSIIVAIDFVKDDAYISLDTPTTWSRGKAWSSTATTASRGSPTCCGP